MLAAVLVFFSVGCNYRALCEDEVRKIICLIRKHQPLLFAVWSNGEVPGIHFGKQVYLVRDQSGQEICMRKTGCDLIAKEI